MGDMLKNLRERSQKRKKLLAQTVSWKKGIVWKMYKHNLKHSFLCFFTNFF